MPVKEEDKCYCFIIRGYD